MTFTVKFADKTNDMTATTNAKQYLRPARFRRPSLSLLSCLFFLLKHKNSQGKRSVPHRFYINLRGKILVEYTDLLLAVLKNDGRKTIQLPFITGYEWNHS